MVYWNDRLERLVRHHYPSGDLDALAKQIGTSVEAIKYRARKMGLKRKGVVYKPWTEKQLAAIKAYYPIMTMDYLVILTRHSKEAIYGKAKELGLKKSKTYMQVPRPYRKRTK